MKAVKGIPGTVTKVDADGTETTEAMTWQMLPPAPGKCPICAAKHTEVEPHNAQSMPYQMAFYGQVGRWPTWADAMAHCTPQVQADWRRELEMRGQWSEPPEGEEPVKHHGVE